jgi:hypothetical protein
MTPALDAISRLDDGISLPGDAEIARIFDEHANWEHLRLDDARRQQEYADWLAEQCPACEEGGTGPVCDECADVPGGEGGS